ncbi:5'-methylthioadenosine/S-adenosylhomocysteine nucleosidase [Williamsoniiplasma lucivorax]|uniref:adenosylhomocysteine nucleosidase n=1 Tax=Williamsoniiplasma lucivorax TaxID=209274 RepID=A0A2S5RE09_9MOLU|nr:5'-methylthioadenosine/S-adenosylhomocysteine nucleosidase [Williamsoniiplasma lucivorax]PPE05537.1 5'-methylthioadenosine/S-adenosylhomocysteine nucleosidase [Williamsoniiplasma lucivorax]
MKIIVGAMFEELEQVIKTKQLTRVENSRFEEFKSLDHQLVVCITGIGTINAASGLTYLLTKYQNVEQVINLGTSGAIEHNLQQGEVVIVDKASYPTTNVTSFGYVHGQVPRMPQYFASDQTLVAQQIHQFKQTHQDFKIVNAATMDVFVDNQQIVDEVISKLPFPSQIVEMEVASYMQVAYLFKVSFIGIKIISDHVISPTESSLEFNEFLKQAAKKLSEII